MEKLKEKLFGLVVILALGVIFIPMLFNDETQSTANLPKNLPPAPKIKAEAEMQKPPVLAQLSKPAAKAPEKNKKLDLPAEQELQLAVNSAELVPTPSMKPKVKDSGMLEQAKQESSQEKSPLKRAPPIASALNQQKPDADSSLAFNQAAQQQAADQRLAEQKHAAEQQVIEKQAQEQRLAEQQLADKQAAERAAEQRRLAEQQAAAKQLAEQQLAAQQAAEQRVAEQRRLAEQQAAAKQAAEQRAAEQQRLAEQQAAAKQVAEQRAANQKAGKKAAPVATPVKDQAAKLPQSPAELPAESPGLSQKQVEFPSRQGLISQTSVQEKPSRQNRAETKSAQPVETSQQKERPKSQRGNWSIQLGSFASEQNAHLLAQKLRAAGYDIQLRKIFRGGHALTVVTVKAAGGKSHAMQLKDELEEKFNLETILMPSG